MRKLTPLLFTLLFIIPLACGEEEPEAVENGVEPAPERRDINLERFGLTFTVGGDLWDSGELIQDPAQNADTALLRSPATGAYLSVLCRDTGRGLTDKDRDLALADKLWELEPSLPGMKETGRELVEVGGIEAVRVELAFAVEGAPWRAWDWTLVEGTTLCGIQFAAPEEHWAGYADELAAILSSFTLEAADEVPPLS